jgi:glutaredoxin-like protein NrdH
MTIVYTNPNCVACDQTKRWLDKNNLDYDVVDLSKDSEALAMVQDLGFKAAPVVITDADKWAGFRLDKLQALAA